ncbi:MAG TPA: Uma2 family endonuclease [Gemmataceae bacterium]|jgi:Uma2 family endonuclease|nr:Uma2 family endonuclease [Gemmataceae bacterium]
MNQIISPPLPGTQEDPRHPDSDGRFMGDTDFHKIGMNLLYDALEDHFAAQADVYIASNLIYYWQEGDWTQRRDPDVLVAKGVAGKHRRRSYRLWEEKKIPCTFFEIASKRTWRVDLREKTPLYASLGIKEYFLFDPEGKYLKPVLQGFKRVKGEPVAMKPAKDGSLTSKELGLRLVPEGEMLRLIDLATGQPVLTRIEKAEREHHRAEALEAEVERLRRQLAQHQPPPGP